ncbi:hypothetical protein BJX65DRAFT_193136 [Aspergillus insuetus]
MDSEAHISSFWLSCLEAMPPPSPPQKTAHPILVLEEVHIHPQNLLLRAQLSTQRLLAINLPRRQRWISETGAGAFAGLVNREPTPYRCHRQK